MFGVVIPYFQRAEGVLARSLASVAAQDVECPVRVVIVDDESPVPAELEVEKVRFPPNIRVEVIRQKNSGPGAARNTALDVLGDESYIAFLDSDDEWEPFHLSSALHAFEHGFDYYTAETIEGDSGYRRHADYFNGALPLIPCLSAPWAQELAEPLINFTVWGPISGSSTFIVRNSLIGDTRFCRSLRTAGEDGLFATMLAAKGPRVMISTRTDVVLGKGVNIFSEGDWGSRSGTLRSIYFLRSRLMMRPLVRDFPVARIRVEERIQKARRELCKSAFANLRRGCFPWAEFRSVLAVDPVLLRVAPSVIFDLVLKR
ncbi:MAG: glycosyltransferase family A protein [Azoarcus sp.]|nr:glycosyltransferase family A protein [Azoarcus sp.]